ncbi:hypothetical protein IWQ62_003626 [Dispira parvispora]|uniref:Essential protein Yae1 N-terminal domain-containing protein n=1 Tax=Dispira parvispora TaxID=1520584 RepID=A0A9W8ATU0_9FUNG|nr:hypothetical protein IWQ62_003626 [Dispira parvispora]
MESSKQDKKTLDSMGDLVYLEEMDDGLQEGVRVGQLEGREFGARKGFEVGQEVGFYLGVSLLWLSLLQRQPSPAKNPARAIKHFRDVCRLIHQFPLTNDHSVDFLAQLDKIRAKARLALVSVGSNQRPSASKPAHSKITY